MVKHLDFNDLKIIKENKPELIFYSQTGACGDSGLILIMLDLDHFFVANSLRTIKSKEYEALIKETIRCVPELDPLGLQIKDEHYKARKGYRYIYYGLGNAGFIKEETLVKYNLKTFKQFSEFVHKYASNFHKISINGGDIKW